MLVQNNCENLSQSSSMIWYIQMYKHERGEATWTWRHVLQQDNKWAKQLKRGKTGKMCKLKAETKPIIVTAAESRWTFPAEKLFYDFHKSTYVK